MKHTDSGYLEGLSVDTHLELASGVSGFEYSERGMEIPKPTRPPPTLNATPVHNP